MIQFSRVQPHLVQFVWEFEASQKQSVGPLVWLIQAQSVDEGHVTESSGFYQCLKDSASVKLTEGFRVQTRFWSNH